MWFHEFPRWLEPLDLLVRGAGRSILEVRDQGVEVWSKTDQSPVTLADRRSQEILLAGLEKITPGVPIVSEEQAAPRWQVRQQWRNLWLVDPLDGTREFVAGRDEFTVNLAFVEDGVPVFGMIYQPVIGRLMVAYKQSPGETDWASFVADSRGCWARLEFERSRPSDPDLLRVVVSHRYGDSDLQHLPSVLAHRFSRIEALRIGSALKFCLMAEGKADFYVRRAPTCEWDTAAGQALLAAVGGGICGVNGLPLSCNRSESLINPPFFAFGPRLANLDWLPSAYTG